MDLILSVADYKKLRRIDEVDEARDEQLLLAAEGATDAILQHTDRAFTEAQVTETRTFPYDGSGILEIDDATAVTALVFGARTLEPDIDFFLEPKRGPGITFYWIDLATARGSSPAMGFTRNEDVLAREGWAQRRKQRARYLVEVTGTWGWPTGQIPASVRIAASWLMDDMAPEAGEDAQSGRDAESIADLAYVNRGPEDRNATAILPPKVLSLLAPFERWSV